MIKTTLKICALLCVSVIVVIRTLWYIKLT